MRRYVAMGLVAAAMPAVAQPGAPVGAATQPGAWSDSGWRTGARTPEPSVGTASAPQPAAAPSKAPSVSAAYPASPQRYRPIEPGRKLPGGYADPIYTVYDWRAYGLETPYPGTRWIRYFDDAVLADAHGRAIIVRRVAWNAPRRRPAPPTVASYVPPVASTRTVRTGPDTTVTTQVIPPPTGYYGGGYGPDYGWGPGVTVTPSVVTTTTTTRYEPVATRRR